MFDYDQQNGQGLGPGRWLKWFMVAMVIYGLSTLWTESRIAAAIGVVFAAIGYGIARYQIARGRRDE